MISHKYRCIFVEVPKTGTTSICNVIGRPEKPHLNICQIADQAGKEAFSSYFKFGFVRNPWDRIVSLYERQEGLRMKSRMDFPAFVEWIKFSSATCIHPVPHRYQLDWFVSPHGDVVVDFIGRFENLDADWGKTCKRLGIDQPLPKANINPGRKPYTDYYNNKTRKIVADRFAVDIEFFGYRFGD